MVLDEKKIILKHALHNAYKHEGKAEFKIVVSKIAAENPELRKRIKELIPLIKETVDRINNMSIEEQVELIKKEFPDILQEEKKEAEEKTLPPLPGVDEKTIVKTRFAPNPDFVIHLGNARPAILSYEYAKMYKGKMVLRFEDTDPRTKTPLPEAYHLIKEDLKWLGISWDEEYIQSLRMEIYYRIARELLEKGGAYIDDLPKEEYVKLMENGKPHPNRDADPEKNLELFDKMLEGHFNEGEAALRVKTNLNYKDKSLIDWVAFRIIDTDKHPHPIVGSKYIVWPTYNFAAGVDDYLMGITHVIRGKEHRQNTIKQQHLYQHLGWKQPETVHLGRLKLEGFIMSKSEIKKILEENTAGYTGPDDPRFATIMGLRRRGITPEAIRNMILTVGAKKTDASISFVNLAAENRKILDPISPRIMYVESPVYFRIDNDGKGCINTSIPYHPDNKDLGSRNYTICDGDEIAISKTDYEETLKKTGKVRLMELGNYKLMKDKLILYSQSLEEAKKEKLKIIQWIKTTESKQASMLVPEGNTMKISQGRIENTPLIESYEKKPIQLIRLGFAIIEASRPMVKMVFSHK